jgi:hypothetical protein
MGDSVCHINAEFFRELILRGFWLVIVVIEAFEGKFNAADPCLAGETCQSGRNVGATCGQVKDVGVDVIDGEQAVGWKQFDLSFVVCGGSRCWRRFRLLDLLSRR